MPPLPPYRPQQDRSDVKALPFEEWCYAVDRILRRAAPDRAVSNAPLEDWYEEELSPRRAVDKILADERF